jgi:hypothetical protein
MTSVAAFATVENVWSALGIAPGSALRMTGMRRSGNHAIANWLQRNADRALFLNNCRPGHDPLRSHNGIEVSGQRYDGSLQDAAAGAGDGALLLLSYEDTVHLRFDSKDNLSGPYKSTSFDGDLLIYRSFLNWSASLLKKLQRNETYRSADRMAVMARALATYGDLLAEVLEADSAARCAICYDDWATDADYRARVLTDLGLPVRDNDLGAVQGYGGGSSFDAGSPEAGDLRVTARWQAMAPDPEYRALLRVAALDRSFMDRLAALFPADAARMTRVAAQPDFDPEVLT